MIGFCSYNFCKDINCIDPVPTDLNGITYTMVQNGIFDHLNIDQSTDKEYTPEKPLMWDYSTILNANFDCNIKGGNIDDIFANVTSLRVKRRKVGEFEWITLFDAPISTFEDLKFDEVDMLNQHGVEYQYAIIPMTNSIEGDYAINTVESWFDGVFICDHDTIFKFYAGVSYGETEVVQRTGIFEPLATKYPIVVANALTGYSKGSMQGTVTSKQYLEDRILDRFEEQEFRKDILDFMLNKRAKLLKDWNGNVWLMIIIDSPTVSYTSEIGMGVASINANWAEIGDFDSEADLVSTGILPPVTPKVRV